MIYTSPGFWNSYGKIKDTSRFDPKWNYYPLWVAHYTTAAAPQVPEPWKSMSDWTFWQYTANGNGLLYGAESKSLDMNWFNGDMEDLIFFSAAAETTPTDGGIEDPTPPTGGGNANTELVEASYIQKEIELLGSRIKNIETYLSGFRSTLQAAGCEDTRTEASS